MSKLIVRKISFNLSLKEAWDAVGFKEKGICNEYLDADSEDDVNHRGYSDQDGRAMDWALNDRHEGAEKIFPGEVSMAMETAERSKIAEDIGNQRREAIKSALEMIRLSPEYEGVTADGEPLMVALGESGIDSVEINTAGNLVTIVMTNPEHVLNAIIDGMGGFYPHEIIADKALSEGELKAYFISNIGDYFEVYGESLPCLMLDSRYSPDINKEYFNEELNYRISELLSLEIAERINDSLEGDHIDGLKEGVAIAVRMTSYSKKILNISLKTHLESEMKASTEKTHALLIELGEDDQ